MAYPTWGDDFENTYYGQNLNRQVFDEMLLTQTHQTPLLHGVPPYSPYSNLHSFGIPPPHCTTVNPHIDVTDYPSNTYSTPPPPPCPPYTTSHYTYISPLINPQPMPLPNTHPPPYQEHKSYHIQNHHTIPPLYTSVTYQTPIPLPVSSQHQFHPLQVEVPSGLSFGHHPTASAFGTQWATMGSLTESMGHEEQPWTAKPLLDGVTTPPIYVQPSFDWHPHMCQVSPTELPQHSQATQLPSTLAFDMGYSTREMKLDELCQDHGRIIEATVHEFGAKLSIEAEDNLGNVETSSSQKTRSGIHFDQFEEAVEVPIDAYNQDGQIANIEDTREVCASVEPGDKFGVEKVSNEEGVMEENEVSQISTVYDKESMEEEVVLEVVSGVVYNTKIQEEAILKKHKSCIADDANLDGTLACEISDNMHANREKIPAEVKIHNSYTNQFDPGGNNQSLSEAILFARVETILFKGCEVDELRAEVEKLKEECHTKTKLYESPQKANSDLLLIYVEIKTLVEQKSLELDAKTDELSEGTQTCENTKSSCEGKELLLKNFNFVNEKLIMEYVKTNLLGEKNKKLVVALDEVIKFQDCYRETYSGEVFWASASEKAEFSCFPNSVRTRIKWLSLNFVVANRLEIPCVLLHILLPEVLSYSNKREQLNVYLRNIVVQRIVQEHQPPSHHFGISNFVCVEDHRNIMFNGLWKIVVSYDVALQITTTKMLTVFVPYVDAKVVPTLMTLDPDQNLRVKYESNDFFGLKEQNFKNSDKIRFHIDAFLKDGSHEAKINVIRAMVVVAKAAPKIENIKAIEQDYEHYYLVAGNQSSIIRELTNKIAMFKPAEMERIISIQEQIFKLDKERFIIVLRLTDQCIKDLCRWVISSMNCCVHFLESQKTKSTFLLGLWKIIMHSWLDACTLKYGWLIDVDGLLPYSRLSTYTLRTRCVLSSGNCNGSIMSTKDRKGDG